MNEDESAHSDESPPGSSEDVAEKHYLPSQLPDSFAQFAATSFQYKATPVYSCAVLPNSLLPPKERADHLAAMAAWILVLRIMGDMPDLDLMSSLSVSGSNPDALTKVKRFFNKKYSKKEVEDAQKKYSEVFKDPTNSDIAGIPFLSDTKESMLEKVQYICMMGIYRPEMRDELYCQLCKQLTNNPSKNSTARGWVLMYLYTGSFAPGEKFVSCLVRFLREGPTEFAPQCERLLRQTFSNGTRGYPPSWLEFQAAKNNKPLLLPVSLMGGQRLLIGADPSTTLTQFCRRIANKIGLHDRTGFSVYITLFRKISCLGHGLHRIMDAVAECEIHTKQMGMRESSATWRLYYRREFFPPWHVPGGDLKAIDLTYQQVMRGISVAEYKCENDDDIVLMAARRYYIEHVGRTDPKKVEPFLTAWLPESCLQTKPLAEWMEQFNNVLKEELVSKNIQRYDVKEEVVKYSKGKWMMLFSRCYDLTKLQGPNFQWNSGVLAVNFDGFYVMDESDKAKIHLPFIEISHVSRGSRQQLTLTTVKGEQYTVTSPHSDDMFNLLILFVDGLKQRSIFAVVLESSSNFGKSGQSVIRGDLLILDKTWEDFSQSADLSGTCKRSDQIGSLPKTSVHVLTTTTEPTSEFMGLLAVQLKKDGGLFAPSNNNNNTAEPNTLENYAKNHFRKTGEGSVSKLLSKASFKKKSQNQQWLYQKEPLKRPLLRKLQLRPDTHSTANTAFTSILQYMSDSSEEKRVGLQDLVNATVMEAALRNRYMREEMFCQLIKQVSQNPDALSEDRGWQLLWLLCGITFPSSDLFEECVKYFKSSSHRLAMSCLDKITKLKHGGSRHFPPHRYEFEAAESKDVEINIHVYFPDQTSQLYQVSSTSRALDLCVMIANGLELKTSDEYSLFFSAGEKGCMDQASLSMVAIPADDYLFDHISFSEIYWIRRRPSYSPPRYLTLFFMKKLWVNASPDLDLVADVKFHYTQELPNYLRGFHKVREEEAITLAAFIYLAKHGSRIPPITDLQKSLSQLVPCDLLKKRSPESWCQAISQELSGKSGLEESEAKLSFLRTVSKWQTYGSVFFEVKQKSAKSYPREVLMAINTSGILLLDRTSKEMLVTYGYSKIPNWQFDQTHFTLLIGDTVNTAKMVLETNLGHNMDDLIMSYITWLMNYHMKKKGRSGDGDPSGESYC